MSGRYEEPYPVRRFIGHPVFWGVVATLGVMALVLWVGTFEDCGLTGGITGSCATKAEQFWKSPPEEMAQVVMAVSAMIGALWLMVLAWILTRRKS